MDAHANFCTFLPTSAPTCLISGPLAEILLTFAPASSGGRKGGQSTLVIARAPDLIIIIIIIIIIIAIARAASVALD